MACLCRSLLVFHAGVRQDVYGFPGGHTGGSRLRAHRLPVQLRPLSGEHLDEGAAVGGRHADAHAGPDRRGPDQHHLRPAADLRHVRTAGAWHRGSGHRHGGRPDRGRPDRDAKGLPALSRPEALPQARPGNLLSRRPEYPDAVGLYLLHIRPESHPVRLFRSGGDCSGPLLQVADLFLHPLGRHADLHRAGHQL